jgi:hypothetical protein
MANIWSMTESVLSYIQSLSLLCTYLTTVTPSPPSEAPSESVSPAKIKLREPKQSFHYTYHRYQYTPRPLGRGGRFAPLFFVLPIISPYLELPRLPMGLATGEQPDKGW